MYKERISAVQESKGQTPPTGTVQNGEAQTEGLLAVGKESYRVTASRNEGSVSLG